jgi:hypothetical protein
MFCSFSYLLRIYPLTRCFSSCSPLRGVSLVSKFIGLREDYDLTNFLDELVAFCVPRIKRYLLCYTSDRHFARRDTFQSARAHAQLAVLTIHNVVGSLSWFSYCLTGNFLH